MIYELTDNKPVPEKLSYMSEPQGWIIIGRRVVVVTAKDERGSDVIMHFPDNETFKNYLETNREQKTQNYIQQTLF